MPSCRHNAIPPQSYKKEKKKQNISSEKQNQLLRFKWYYFIQVFYEIVNGIT